MLYKKSSSWIEHADKSKTKLEKATAAAAVQHAVDSTSSDFLNVLSYIHCCVVVVVVVVVVVLL